MKHLIFIFLALTMLNLEALDGIHGGVFFCDGQAHSYSVCLTNKAGDAIEQSTDTLTVMVEPRLYDNVPLEQMLAELSAYYQVDVEYRTDDVRSLRLYYEWEPDYSLDMVVDMLSHFESLSISREGNKLIVESAQEGK